MPVAAETGWLPQPVEDEAESRKNTEMEEFSIITGDSSLKNITS